MADFKHSILKVLKTEGGYVNDPDDSGGETYKGIARNFWKNWPGWPIIDHAKGDEEFPNSLSFIELLQNAVISFYKANFWDKVGGDGLSDQSIADMLVDSAVNEGVKPAVKRAQGIAGLPVTGIIDSELVKRLNSMV